MTEAAIEFLVAVDADDVVRGLRNNDEAILAFIIEMLAQADSSDLRERLSERLTGWDEEFPKEEES